MLALETESQVCWAQGAGGPLDPLASSGLAGLFLLYPSSFSLQFTAFSLPRLLLVPGFLDFPGPLLHSLLPNYAPFQRSCFLMPLSPGHSIIPPTRCLTFHWILEVPTGRVGRIWLGDSRPPQVFPD